VSDVSSWPATPHTCIPRDDRTEALDEIVGELLGMDEPRRRLAGMMSGLACTMHEGTDFHGHACKFGDVVA
jgi:hypothetical protein